MLLDATDAFLAISSILPSLTSEYKSVVSSLYSMEAVLVCYLLAGPPEGEGSSAILRLSIPTTERLSVIVRVDEVVLEEVLLDALQSIVQYILRQLLMSE